MIVAKEYLQANRAALFDWIVLLTSFLMGFIFPSLSDFIQSKGFFNWMFVALLMYIVGAALKDLPLSTRMSAPGRTVEPIPYVIFLLVGHWFIILFLVILSESAIRTFFHFAPLTDKNTASWQIITGSVFTASVVTWLVYRTKSDRKRKKPHSEKRLFWQEIAADLLLISAVSVFSFVIWEKGAMAMLGKASMKSFGEIWFLFVFLAILFLFFYLPLRYLYFIEDRGRGRNRRRLLLIFAFLLIKAIIEMIGI